MEIIKRILKPDIIAINEDEIDDIDWKKVKYGCFYLDIWGNIHLEINNKGYLTNVYTTNWWDLFIKQSNIFTKLPMRLLKACRTKPVSDLIGARQFIYVRKEKMIIPSNVGILPWKFIEERGDLSRNPQVGEIRRTAYSRLFAMLDTVAGRLGAKFGLFLTSVISDEKMKKYGCQPYEVKGLKLRFFKLAFSFPIRNTRIYVKIYK